MATNQGIDLNLLRIIGGYDISSTTVYHPSGIRMKTQELDTLKCPRCSKFLREPVQLITCGCRFCAVCIDSMLANESSLKCPVDLTDFTKKHVRKDKGCVKEINILQVDCVLKCGWKGLLVEVEDHVNNDCLNAQVVCELGCGQEFPRSEREKHSVQCGKQSVVCDFCKMVVTKDELTTHQQSVCQEYPVTCDYCLLNTLKRKDLQQHLEDVCEQYEMDCPSQQFTDCQFKGKKKPMSKHVQEHTALMFENFGIMWERMDKMERENEKLVKIIEEKEEKIVSLSKQLTDKDDMLTKLDDRLRNVEMTVRHGHELPDIVETDRAAGSRKTKSKGAAVVRSSGQRVAIDGGSNVLSRRVANVAENSETHTNQIQQLNQNVQMLQESITQQTIVVDELRLRQDILDVRTTNGTFVWKIPDIRRRYREAIDRRTVSIYSPPYFTSPQGYRICTRVYLNGDGIGKGTHISVFFVLMKSEHDSLLAWPFKQSVRFTLINQVNKSASVTEAFAPDLSSPSFQQPESEMNIASGFPKFAKQSVLQDDNFTKGNTIYIKAQVDLNGLGTY